MDDCSDSESNKLGKAFINSDQAEDSGYASNISELSELLPHQTPNNNFTSQYHPSSASFVSSSSIKVHQDYTHVSKRCRFDPSPSFQDSPFQSSFFANLGKRGSISEDSQTLASAAKKSRSECDGEVNSATKSSFEATPRLAEAKFHISTPYSDFIDKLRYSPSPSARTSLIGMDHVDFLYFLGVKNIHNPVLQRIFSHLSDYDLYSASRVSKTWNHLITNNSMSGQRIKNFLLRPLKENVAPFAKSCENEELPGSLVGRVRLMEIQNRAATSQNVQNESRGTPNNKSPPVSPSKVRFHLFQKEGQKLDPGEQLVQCPRCSLPSRQDKVKNLGLCTRQGCQHQFCLTCHCEFHEPHSCTVLTPRYGNKNSLLINSKASRRFLRRL